MPEGATDASEFPGALVVEAVHPMGSAIARILSRNGYAVVVHSQHARVEVDRLCAEIVTAGGRAAGVTADLADRESVLRLVPDARAAVGPLSLLVNNFSALEEGIDCERRVAISLRAPIFLAQSFARQIPDGADAAVIHLTAQRPTRRHSEPLPDVGISHALAIDITALARSFAPRIRVNAIAVGEVFEHADAADAVLYLAQARSITGVTLAIGGGRRGDQAGFRST
jgi:NAD(P)-dependent dehydrogenase (short-subunit alcohol dehydrogenase family)